MHLHGRAIGRFAHPYVEVLALARFEEENIVTIIEFGEFVKLVKFCFCVEFSIFAAVREEGVEVIEEVTMTVGNRQIRTISFWGWKRMFDGLIRSAELPVSDTS